MKTHAILLAKNEADIIGYTLDAAAAWADCIYVFDTGSTDDTWDIVQAAAKRHPQVVPWKYEARSYDDNLRGEVFRAMRANVGPADWWCKLDADEVYAEDPRPILAAAPRGHHVVWAIHVQYYLTETDVARFDLNDPRIPRIAEANRPRYYRANSSEQRFFRHRPRLDWSSGSWPRHLGVVHPRRILLRHFQYRSPQQVQSRLDIRRQAAAAGYRNFSHSLQQSWREVIQPAAGLHYDDGRAPLQVNEAEFPRHLEPASRRLFKHLMHGTGLWP
jgi:glycosyltransferase involved in cell wall biosynthesis